MKYIIGKQSLTLLLLVALVLLTGCQSDGADTAPKNITVEMQAYATTYNDVVQAASTRTWPPSADFEVYSGHDAIRVAFMTTTGYARNSSDVPADGSFVYNENKWYSTFKVDGMTNNPYYLYGYMPAVGNLSLAPVSSSYANGATMTITGLPSTTTSDVCVIVGVKKGNSASDDNGIQMGQFSYDFSGTTNHVFLLCDHLYAALLLKIRVDATYHALRHINLKKVWVKDCKNGSTTFTSKSRAIVTLVSNELGNSPIQNPITFEPDGSSTETDMEQNPLYVSVLADGLPLTTEYKPVQGYMGPLGMTDFTLVSLYDVYDTNVTPEHPNGNLIRENQIAENKINISSLFTNTSSLQRGTRYTLYLTVKPTYLYMLSEPDLDNPTVEVGN